jgi:LPXTG-site transpeptidase (sortase) family protein
VRVAPTSLTIGDLGVSQAVQPVGLDDKGAMEIPSVSEIGWYLHGAAPGLPGATVLVAHVWWGDTPGPFRRLGALDLGASIEVGIGDTIRSYQVVKRTMYDKDELPSDLWRNSGPETLVLITCGGEFNRATKHYEQNIVVYAVPAQNTTDPQQPT